MAAFATSKPPHDTQSFFPRNTELFPSEHRAFFHGAQSSSHRCTELSPTGTQSFYRYTELLPSVHRAFTGTQSFYPRCTELLPSVHRASFWQPLQPWFVKETAFFFAKAQNLRIRLDSYAGFLWHRAFTGTQSFYPGKQSPLQCKYKFIYPDFLGKGKSIFWA